MRAHRAGVFDSMLDSIQSHGWGRCNKTGIKKWEGGDQRGDGGIFALPGHQRQAIRSVNHIKVTVTRGGAIAAKIYYALAVV